MNKRYNFWEEFSFFTNPIVSLSGVFSEIDFSLPIFRARLYDGFNINDRKELQYPGKDHCIKIGRANIPFHPVFYGSYSKECAVNELKIGEKKSVVVSNWKWKSDISIQVKLFSKRDPSWEQTLKKYNIRSFEDYIKMAEKKGVPLTPVSLHGRMIDQMMSISDLFLDEKDYFGSAIVGYEELYRTRLSSNVSNTDLLVYPSVFNNGGVNVAIHPDVVDKYLDVQSVELIDVVDYGKF